MADSVPGKHLSRTILGASEDLTFYCEICAVSGECEEVYGYCENCEEYLCKGCFDNHLKPKPLRNHKLLNKNDMPKVTTREAKQPEVELASNEVCEEHLKERLNFYCPGHEKFCCGTCVALGHKLCENVEYFPEVAGDYPNSDEFKAVEAELENLKVLAGDCKSQLSQKADANNNHTEKVLREIDNFRETLINDLDKREEEVTLQVSENNQRSVERISHMLNSCEDIEKEVDDLQKEMMTLKTNKQHCQLYLLIKKISTTTKRLNTKLPGAEQLNDTEDFKFYPNTYLAKVLGEPNAFGKFGKIDFSNSTEQAYGRNTNETNERATSKRNDDISEGQDLKDDIKSTSGKCKSVSALASKSALNDNNPFNFKKLQTGFDIDMKSFSDEKKPWITGITEINDNDHHVVAVYNSQHIAVIDSRQKRIKAETKLQSGPWDVTSIIKGEVIATLPFKNKLIFVKVYSVKGQPSGVIEMKIKKQIDVNGDCHSITNDGEHLFVSYQKPGKIEIIETGGSVLKVIECNADGKQLFTEPQYIAYNTALKLLYISDWDTNEIICMTTDGVVRDTYKDETLKAPTGIAIDKGGNVFVAGYHSNNILQLSPTFKDVQLVLDKREKVVWPQAIAFSANGNKFLVGLRNNEALKVFRVK